MTCQVPLQDVPLSSTPSSADPIYPGRTKQGNPRKAKQRTALSLCLRNLFPLTAFKNAPNPKFVQYLSRRLFLGVLVGGGKNLKKIVKICKTVIFRQIRTIFFKFLAPRLEPPKNNRRDKFWTNLGFGAFLNAVRGKRVRKQSVPSNWDPDSRASIPDSGLVAASKPGILPKGAGGLAPLPENKLNLGKINMLEYA